jgi:hypothetical protein
MPGRSVIVVVVDVEGEGGGRKIRNFFVGVMSECTPGGMLERERGRGMPSNNVWLKCSGERYKCVCI